MVSGNIIIKTKKKSHKKVYIILKYCIIFSIIYILISSTCRIVFVEGRSMEPTIHNNDVIIVNRLSYKLKSVKTGDIIIFPHNELDTTSYIKRVIALPGDKIDIKNNHVYINNISLEEPYICEDMLCRGDIKFPIVVPENHYFVLGDNRNHSSDSRYSDVGMIYIDNIIGKAQIKIWPIKDIELYR